MSPADSCVMAMSSGRKGALSAFLHCLKLRLRRKRGVAAVADEDTQTIAVAVPEGRANAYALAVGVPREDVESGDLLRRCGLVFGCHVSLSLFALPFRAMHPARQQAGAASDMKIGGNLEGEPIFLLTREASGDGREQRQHEGLCRGERHRLSKSPESNSAEC